jgi:transposase
VEVWVLAGIDSHKDTLAVAVIDAAGRTVTVRQIANEPDGFTVLADLVTAHSVARVGIEGSTNFGWAAAMHLVAAGVTVVEVPPLMTSRARERQSRPGQGKTDPVDAVAVARITAREAFLPPVRPMDGLPAELRVLMDYREQLIDERTALANRIHADLGWLRPGYQRRLPRLTQPAHLQSALALLDNDGSVRASVTRRRLQRMVEINAELAGRRTQITELVEQSGTTLTGIYGVGVFVAARILAEVVDVGRYPTRHTFAAANGSAPTPGLLRAHGAPSPQPRWQPAAEPGALHDRDHRDSRRHRRPGLLRTQTRRGQDQPGGAALPQAPALRRRLPHAARRSGRQPTSAVRRGRLRAVGARPAYGTRLYGLSRLRGRTFSPSPALRLSLTPTPTAVTNVELRRR